MQCEGWRHVRPLAQPPANGERESDATQHASRHASRMTGPAAGRFVLYKRVESSRVRSADTGR